MSKKRPGHRRRSSEPGSRLLPPSKDDLAYWNRRLFRNTYTREGKRFTVDAWSVKVQHQGQRRSFTLKASRRADAAREAFAIYQRIVTTGWADVIAATSSDNAVRHTGLASTPQETAKSDIAYWRARLLRRPYPLPQASDTKREWSVRIEHRGTSQFFPLRTEDEEWAAALALSIYRSITSTGWEDACRRFPREVTLAIHWAANPLVWTYATFHTRPVQEASFAPPPTAQAHSGLRIAIVESDSALARALVNCLGAQLGFIGANVFSGADDALAAASASSPDLWLVNHALPRGLGNEFLERLKRVAPKACGLLYSVYEDSNQLFSATPGGASAYLLKRTPPERLLDPLFDQTLARPLSVKQIGASVRQYFQAALVSVSPSDSIDTLQGLTYREQEILELLSKGLLDKEIAARLNISVWTVHGHVKKIFEKLGVHTRTEAVVKFLQK